MWKISGTTTDVYQKRLMYSRWVRESSHNIAFYVDCDGARLACGGVGGHRKLLPPESGHWFISVNVANAGRQLFSRVSGRNLILCSTWRLKRRSSAETPNALPWNCSLPLNGLRNKTSLPKTSCSPWCHLNGALSKKASLLWGSFFHRLP